MTEQRRKEIFSQEALSVKDVEDLYGVSYSKAATLIRQWKRQGGDRLGIVGKIHVLDYKKAIRRDDDVLDSDEKEEENHDQAIRGVRSVCYSKSSIYG